MTEKILLHVQKYILYITVLVFPIFVSSVFGSPYVLSKEVLLFTSVLLLISLWTMKIIVNGKLTFFVGKFDLGVILMAVAFIVSTLFATPNKMEAFLLPGTTTFVLAGVLLYFLINQLTEKVKKGSKIYLFISGIILSLGSLLSSLNVFAKIPQLPAFVKDTSFSPMGGAIPTIILLIVILIFSVSIFYNEKEPLKKIFYGVSLTVIGFGLLGLIISVLPGKSTTPRFASMQDSWEITIDTLKKNPVFGSGPANYLTAFNIFRPVTYNNSDLWQIRFTTASNMVFTLITETGLLGFFALTTLFISIYRFLKNNLKFSMDKENFEILTEKAALVIFVMSFIILPISSPLIVIFFVILAILSKSEHKNLHLNVSASDSSSLIGSRVPAIIVALPFIVGAVAVFYYGVKILSAEATFTKSLNALSANDAKATYDLMSSAINKNPKVDRYHASFAQVNMALASDIASKKEISEADRTTVTQLVQQAISEGKATVSLNPTRSANWEILAQIYKSVMPFAQGADQFAIQTFSQAIALDPTNPNLRLSLGGVYYSLGNFDMAIDSFKLAVLAKPDLANAHYNLAIAYREKKDYDKAIDEINNVINLIDKNSKDFEVASKILEDLKARKSAAKSVTGTSENLTPPEPAKVSNIKPPITLPDEATPPAQVNQ